MVFYLWVDSNLNLNELNSSSFLSLGEFLLIVDYYIIKKENIDVNQLFSTSSDGPYYYNGGWNQKAFVAWAIAGVFSVLTVWHPSLSALGGYAWIIGAALGAILHFVMSGRKKAESQA